MTEHPEAARAQDALDRGHAAFATGDLDAALAWFDRAHRNVPTDGTARLSLASVLLARGDLARAEPLFAVVADAFDAQAAWLGLAATRSRAGDVDGAARAAATLLSRFAIEDEGLGPLLDRVVAATEAVGWCGLTVTGELLAYPADPGARPIVSLDGARATKARKVADGTGVVSVTIGGRHLLGSPIAVARQRRVEGWVEADAQGVRGWAWYPGAPARAPRLIVTAAGRAMSITADRMDVTGSRALMQPRGFAMAMSATGPVTVAAENGQALTGSPVDPGREPGRAGLVALAVARRWPLKGAGSMSAMDAALADSPVAVDVPPVIRARVAGDAERPVAIVVPVHRGLAETTACLDALAETAPGVAVHVVDDASPEPLLRALLEARAVERTIVLHRLDRNAGFPAAANVGLRAAAVADRRCDIVLLNSDTVPTAGWLDTLRRVVHLAGDVGSATPLSNDAGIASYPEPGGAAMPDDLDGMAAICVRVAGDEAVEAPTAVGFCAYLRRECLEQTGVLREDAFSQGYGEENDWCLRASHLGWRHVVAPGAYVGHVGGRSFGSARAALIERNLAVLERLHPGWRASVAAWAARDPLSGIKRSLDLARLAATPSTLLVTHDGGGGVERHVQTRDTELRASGQRALVLRPIVDMRPAEDRDDLERRYLVGVRRLDIGSPADKAFPNLLFRVDEGAELAAAARALGVDAVEVHHLHGHDHDVMALPAVLGLGYDVVVHDHAWFCARVTTFAAGRYCGEPDVAVCAACVADHGSRLEEPIAPADLVARSTVDLDLATRVITPTLDGATRLRRHFPAVRPIVRPHESDVVYTPSPRPVSARHGAAIVCVVGAIGLEKGYEVLLACARDAARRELKLTFRIVGHTFDDARLLDTGRVAITGPFKRPEVAGLVRAQGATVGFLPSAWPETWCYALSDLWAGGLSVFAFDIGAQAARVRDSGRGWLMPLGIQPHALNNVFVAHPPLADPPAVMHTKPVWSVVAG